MRLKRRREHEHLAIYPCKLRVLPQNVFNARNPIVMGVSVEAGHVKKGTPICAKTSDGVIFYFLKVLIFCSILFYSFLDYFSWHDFIN